MNKVDAIITWVDGQDPSHQKKLQNTLSHLGIQRPVSASPTRYNACGEIDYCLFSILRYAPWIRKIFIVTDNQAPPIYQKLQTSAFAEKIELIDHQVIFEGYEDYLPTFNSLSIEAMLWRIPNLSERFIYFNDDCFLLNPVNYEDFFQENTIVLRGEWKTHHDYKWQNRLRRLFCPSRVIEKKKKNTHRINQENSARLAGFSHQFFHLPHIPFPLEKKIFADYFAKHPEKLIENIRPPFRNIEQHWPISLAYHLLLKNKQAKVCGQLKGVMINGETHSLKKIQSRLQSTTHNKNIRFLCMQSIDQAPKETQEYLLNWLQSRINIG